MMRAHYGDLLSFEPPPAWIARRTLLLAPAGSDKGAGQSITVARAPRATDIPFRDAVAAHVATMVARTRGMRVIAQQNAVVSGRHAREVRVTVAGERGAAVEQLHVYVDAPEGDFVVLVCSWTGAQEDSATRALRAVLATARFGPETRR